MAAQAQYLPEEILEHDGGEMKLFNKWSYVEIETGKDISLQVSPLNFNLCRYVTQDIYNSTYRSKIAARKLNTLSNL